MFVHVKALESFLRTSKLPVNVKCLFEGEEEVGSANFDAFVQRNARALAADVAVVSDMRILAPDRPAITFSVRGELGLELKVFGQRSDLHSGNFGGAVHNPLQALCEIIARLHDASGRVSIPGFYDDVRPVDDEERARMRRTGPDDRQMIADAGARRPWGERGHTLYERTTVRPALTINGLTGGYQGPGAKAVIPAKASAKISFRLVPSQHPDEVERLFRDHLSRITPPTVRVQIRRTLASRPSVVDRRHPAMRAASAAYSRGFGAAPVFVRLGGSIPIVQTFHEQLKIPTVLMGFALPDDAIHGPNEKFHLPNFHNGITTSIEFLSQFARTVGARRPGHGGVQHAQ
jgi:acetylornithine deacetylase/succinyl-diaminopimelate desuccinylase-like protein